MGFFGSTFQLCPPERTEFSVVRADWSFGETCKGEGRFSRAVGNGFEAGGKTALLVVRLRGGRVWGRAFKE